MISRLKICLILTPLALLLVIAAYVFSLWTIERDKSNAVPVEAIGMMVRDLRRFHEKRGGFPDNLKQMEGVVWEKKENRELSTDHRGLSYRNYYYFYNRLSPHLFTLWAFPTGRLRDDAPTLFLMSTPSGHRRWKGPALGLEQVKIISADPSLRELSVLGLIEQHRSESMDDSKQSRAIRLVEP